MTCFVVLLVYQFALCVSVNLIIPYLVTEFIDDGDSLSLSPSLSLSIYIYIYFCVCVSTTCMQLRTTHPPAAPGLAAGAAVKGS
jgi:hypothetical protein